MLKCVPIFSISKEKHFTIITRRKCLSISTNSTKHWMLNCGKITKKKNEKKPESKDIYFYEFRYTFFDCIANCNGSYIGIYIIYM